MKIIAFILLLFAMNVYGEEQKVLIFFFDQTCPYCQQMAPTVLKTSQKFNLKVVGNNLNGKSTLGFSEVLSNMKLAKIFKIRGLPTIGGVDFKAKTLTVISVGLCAEVELEQRINRWLQEG
jgi:thiol-disulfide isomerase/thioredoxin